MLQTIKFEASEASTNPVGTAMSVIGGKWKGVILYQLIQQEARFNQLRRLIPGITQRMLVLQLRDLEREGLVQRVVYQETPPKIGYRLTDYGRTLVPVILMLKEWGESHQSAMQ
ncbi:winged helix-turn-helix transcriptional regulator [Cohnella rhizosphaerae]|uniref:Helix-turn-helix transcriptional regulator n=1 Tax=Cohnella rhizosphaerae TaxID=1457232 RepID=A0A9X4KVJ9_9BACL|nr:helix-turn-helix domain-containing protein [Cohnella rhizosphaerae]MDG0811685.1 helix-turn-helix transcriptional regulator [Cohnella rhizosphaerae]